MNNRFGRDDRYPNERYRDRRDDRLSEDRFGEDRWLRSPDQEFETSGPYRQPYGDGWNQAPRYGAFMNSLFRRGAFAGSTARQAYFVKADAETSVADPPALELDTQSQRSGVSRQITGSQ